MSNILYDFKETCQSLTLFTDVNATLWITLCQTYGSIHRFFLMDFKFLVLENTLNNFYLEIWMKLTTFYARFICKKNAFVGFLIQFNETLNHKAHIKRLSWLYFPATD